MGGTSQDVKRLKKLDVYLIYFKNSEMFTKWQKCCWWEIINFNSLNDMKMHTLTKQKWVSCLLLSICVFLL